jgi:hypothetical protein
MPIGADESRLGGVVRCWRLARPSPLKRAFWAKLLEKAFGSQFEDTDEMFVEHTKA